MTDTTSAAPEAAAIADAAAKAVAYDNADKRLVMVPLQWPLTVGGTHYAAIGLRRLSAGEVAAFIDKVRRDMQADPDAPVAWPIYADANGNSLPAEVYDALDDDDLQVIEERGRDFLPRRLRALLGVTEPSATTPPSNGGTTAASSSTTGGDQAS